ncbi:hypothetical protein ACFQO1_10385 [Jejudonia soesokkakensis]|uniref:DUF1735 domain-containing protein n=1 Tax=Jejudonia soesokkakensis TaxID=1323432 RepID=A0ABW2MX56_9FLAO
MKKNLLLPFLGVFPFLIAASCVKDTDFNQTDDIVLTPVVELDLIYFNLTASDFYDENTMTERLTLRDTTEIRFLDDTATQDNLVRADFYFEFTNSIPRDFTVGFQFLNEFNEETYFSGTQVNQGSEQSPVVTIFEDRVEGTDLEQLTMANKVIVTVDIPSSNATLQGNLDLQSKATYFLEIDQGQD